MIYLEVIGNRGEGTASSVKNIIKAILTQPDTKQLILIDESQEIIYELGLNEFRMGTANSSIQMQQMILGKYQEKVVYIVPTSEFDIAESITMVLEEHVLQKYKKINAKEKVYCVYFKLSV